MKFFMISSRTDLFIHSNILQYYSNPHKQHTDHVHFEIRVNGKTIDPALVIDFNTQTLLHKRLVFTPTPKGKIQVEAV